LYKIYIAICLLLLSLVYSCAGVSQVQDAGYSPRGLKQYQVYCPGDGHDNFHECIKPIKNYGGLYNAKTAIPRYKPLGEPIKRDNDSGNWVYNLPSKDKEYY